MSNRSMAPVAPATPLAAIGLLLLVDQVYPKPARSAGRRSGTFCGSRRRSDQPMWERFLPLVLPLVLCGTGETERAGGDEEPLFWKGLPSHRRFRDIYDIFEGTEQIQQLVISRAISGLRIE